MSFIIKKPSSSNRTIRLPDTLIEKLTNISTSKNISFNQLVMQCCEYALNHLEDIPTNEDTPNNKEIDT